jgi:DNA-binding LacI/PurR family transcriptional regulator
VNFAAQNVANVVHRLLADPGVTALIDSSATEDGSSLREGARRAGRVPGKDFEIVAWTYVDNSAVLSEASAHLWMPVREAAAEGIEQLAQWLHGERTEPIQLLYRPILRTVVPEIEITKPRRLFELFE